METYYARWYSGQQGAIFRLHFDTDSKTIVSAEEWSDGWRSVHWHEISDWVDFISKDDLPHGVTP